jgi:hypothetical protein
MRGSRTGRLKISTAVVVLAAGLRLLVMHALSLPDHDAGTHARTEHPRMTHDSIASSDARVEASRPEMPSHLHELLGCLWIVAAGVALLFARSTRRRRDSQRDPVAFLRLVLSTTQRAPPSALRLSLVGVSRR